MRTPLTHLHITTGDINGIGAEITAKSLRSLKTKIKSRISVYLSKKGALSFRVFYKNIPKNVTLIVSDDPPPRWVVSGANACLMNPKTNALVTGPLSKPLIHDFFPGKLGHTEILKEVSGEKNLFMTFVGSRFSVILLTGHIALSSVEKSITEEKLSLTIAHALKLRGQLNRSKRLLPVGVLGLNPHSGDSGLIGDFENSFLSPFLKANYSADDVRGPLIPDVAFQNFKSYSVFVALYHDQGLIPFKLQHRHTGAHLTLGLPFVRTSVDHGPAFDIFGKGIANFKSMSDAILLAEKLLGDSI